MAELNGRASARFSFKRRKQSVTAQEHRRLTNNFTDGLEEIPQYAALSRSSYGSIGDWESTSGDDTFTFLLQQLAQLHQGKLEELSQALSQVDHLRLTVSRLASKEVSDRRQIKFEDGRDDEPAKATRFSQDGNGEKPSAKDDQGAHSSQAARLSELPITAKAVNVSEDATPPKVSPFYKQSSVLEDMPMCDLASVRKADGGAPKEKIVQLPRQDNPGVTRPNDHNSSISSEDGGAPEQDTFQPHQQDSESKNVASNPDGDAPNSNPGEYSMLSTGSSATPVPPIGKKSVVMGSTSTVKFEADEDHDTSPRPPADPPSMMPRSSLRDTAEAPRQSEVRRTHIRSTRISAATAFHDGMMFASQNSDESTALSASSAKSLRIARSGRVLDSCVSQEPLDLREDYAPTSGGQVKHVGTFNQNAQSKELSLVLLSDNDRQHSSYKGFPGMFIAFPASPRRLAWDLAGAVLIFWDLVIIPMSISELLPEESTFLDVMNWITLLFWTLNMVASVCVGYVKDGLTVMNPTKILLNYLKTWFILDVLVVIPDWIFTVAKSSGDGGDGSDSVKLLRILRLIRMTRLLRLAKLKAIISAITDLINSEYTSICVNIVKMIITLLAISHVIACGWYLTSEADNSNNWVLNQHFSGDGWDYLYSTSLHWAITQFTPASMSVQPQNTLERTYGLAVVIFGLVGFSYLVGSITGSLTELRKMGSDTYKAFWTLRRYLRQQKVPMELSVRIQKYLEHQWQSMRTAIASDSVVVLKHLSEQLENELQCAISVPHMMVHSLFEYLNTVSTVTMQRLATSAVTRRRLATGDSLFYEEEPAIEMSFIIGGKLRYTRYKGLQADEVTEFVSSNEDWIAEPVLWSKFWYHRGDLLAVNNSELLSLTAKKFPEILKRSPQVHAFVCRYAQNFIEWMNGLDRNDLSDITNGESGKEVVRQMMIGLPNSSNTFEMISSLRKGRPRKSVKQRMTSKWMGAGSLNISRFAKK